jgi:hypothetical protein
VSDLGRPTDYRPEFCEQVIEFGREGKSYTQIAARLDVAKSTLYLWMERHPDFSDAMTRARDLAQSWFEDKGQDGLIMSGFNASLWAKQVSARFPDDYTERQKRELSGPSGGPIETVSRIERVVVDPANSDR